MRKSSRGRREQPQINLDQAALPEENFSLEDILNEFGGWSGRPETPDVPAPDAGAPAAAEQEAAAELQTLLAPEASAPPAEPTRPLPKIVPLDAAKAQKAAPRPSGRIQFVRLEDLEKEEKAPETAGAPPRRARPPREARPEKPEKPPKPSKPPKPEPVYPTAEEAYRDAGKRGRGIFLRRRLAFLWWLAAAALTVCCQMEVEIGGKALEVRLTAQILMGLLIVGALTAYDVLVSGVDRALRLRANLESLLFVVTVVFAVDGFLHIGEENARLPNAAVLLLGLYFALWGRAAGNRARRRSLKAVLSMDEKPQAAVMSRRAWGSRDCVFRTEGSREGYVASLEASSCVDRAMEIYAPSVICLSLVLSVLMRVMQQREFLSCWSIMLAGSLPVAAFITYWKPFAALAKELLHDGAALCGWEGAKRVTGPCCVAMADGDFFSRTHVTMNGMKLFGDHNVARIVGYTYAVMEKTGSGLTPVFHEVFVNQNGRACTIDSFRRYEGGGAGAEIQGDVVLVGSIGFMQLMGVRLPEGTNVRQAVYCAVNQELAAIFALNYNPSGVVRSGLQTILRSKGLTLVMATRDFMLTPNMIRHKYKLPPDCIEYPSVEERVRLSGPYASAGGEQAALLSRDSFLPLAEAVVGGRNLYSSVWAGLWVNLMGGVLGFGITAVLGWLGAFGAASAMNLTLFALLWTLPALLLSSIAGK